MERKKVLVWCGIRDLAAFIATRPRYDLCFVIEADDTYLRPAERIFGMDPGVRLFRMRSVNLLDFCRHNGIERIETLALHTGTNDLTLVKTAERLVRKKRVESNRVRGFCGPSRDNHEIVWGCL